MGRLSNRISRDDLNPGDHIYSWRSAYTYAHHGIYVGENKVIHFIQGRGNELTVRNVLDLLQFSSGPSQNRNECEACEYQKTNNGVICSCLDCFLAGGNLYRFEYGVKASLFVAKVRGGTCTLAETDSWEIVTHRAYYLLENGFRCYKLFKNNCEDFCVYCKTGLLVIDESSIGPSGQAASVIGAFTAIFSSPLRFLITNTAILSVVAGGLYCLSRYAADVAIRRDVTRVPVENLMVSVNLSDSEAMRSTSVGQLTQ